MSASLVVRGLLVSLAIISVSLKVAEGMTAPAAPGDLGHQLRHQLGVFLEREGFHVDGNLQENKFHIPVVKAKRDECRLLVAIVSPKGEHRAFLTQLATPGDQVSFVFQGQIYKEPAIWRPVLYQYLARIQSYAGISTPPSSTIGVVTSPGCDLSDVAWEILALSHWNERP